MAYPLCRNLDAAEAAYKSINSQIQLNRDAALTASPFRQISISSYSNLRLIFLHHQCLMIYVLRNPDPPSTTLKVSCNKCDARISAVRYLDALILSFLASLCLKFASTWKHLHVLRLSILLSDPEGHLIASFEAALYRCFLKIAVSIVSICNQPSCFLEHKIWTKSLDRKRHIAEM